MKHTSHDFNTDDDGKDSGRFKNAGALLTAVSGPGKTAVGKMVCGPIDPLEIAEKHMSRISDIIIIEGHKHSDIPKIEVIGDSAEEPLYLSGIRNIKALACDREPGINLPLFRRDDFCGIARFIEEEFIRRPE